ncbi:cell wall hydrolase [Halonatronum saccharophilum]|uniref:cell wall hydrolase n=1 Tax=Halonatronum saccharophilum TaxID=150060 RepID=UPI0004812B90|nr:cell wall hydrolase [Halonatronum saccharophilum]
MKKSFRVISLTLIFLLLFPYLASFNSPYKHIAYAEDLEDKTVYKGVAVALLLMYFANRFSSSGNRSSSRRGARIDYSSSDLNVLARAVHGEARGEPYEGQVAVAAVIINRVLSDEFPNNIYDVVYQKGQFSAVDDGQINLTPNETSFKAAKEALYGSDPSLGALYFYNPRTARTLWWLETRPTLIDIGNHRFAE